MRGDSVFESVRAIIRRVFSRMDLKVTLKTSAADVPGWDSFKMIEIIMEIEKHFAITMETRDMDEIHCVGDMVLRISDKLVGRKAMTNLI